MSPLRTWLGGLTLALLVGCKPHHKAESAPEPLPVVSVRVAGAEVKAHFLTEDAPATARARLRANIEAKVTALIEEMLVAPGDHVEAGQTLARLETREIQSRLDQAVPVVRNAEAEAKRFKTLLEKKAVSQSDYEALEARFRVAQAAVSEAETMLAYTTIKAPFQGVITRKWAEVGDLATPGRTLLEMEDPRTLRLEADIPESLIANIKLGDRMTALGPRGTEQAEAVVSEIAPAADSATRTFLVKLDLPERSTIKAGQFARVAVPVGEKSSLRIPARAIVPRGQMELAFVVEEDVAKLRIVKTGRRIANEIEVVAGILPGERVVMQNASELRDGQRVEVKP